VTAQPETEPEGSRGAPRRADPTADYRRDPNFHPPERVPWSELGPQFARIWGRADPKDPQPEHEEIVGQNGSGKTHLLLTQVLERAKIRKTGAIIVCTKKADRVFAKSGLPVVDDMQELQKHPQAIYWPQTRKMGNERKAFHDRAISQLLHGLWKEDANVIVAFDEIGYVESLSSDMKALVQQYWREGRSLGITVIGMKQRPQGALRDMHSEAYWTAAFKPKDRADLERWAELFGARRDWMPVFDSLNRNKREFIIANPVYDEAFISWVDVPLVPQKQENRGPSWLPGRNRGA
jgi:nucleoside-triphosphatase THEP1